ncbi:MAG: hypothetical protein HQL53_12385 [Magnetococcales bacterium]|nr:hypothetical protein [Magnetococcales bacterium]
MTGRSGLVKRLLSVSSLILMTALPINGWSEGPGEVMEWSGSAGAINWSRGRVMAEGNGMGKRKGPSRLVAAQACRAATVDAQRNLLETVKGVRIEGETVVEDMILKSDIVKTKVSGVIRGATIKSREIFADEGACTVVMEMAMAGDFASGIFQNMPQSDQSSNYKPSILPSLQEMVGYGLNWLIKPAHASADDSAMQPWKAQINQLMKRLERLEKVVQAQAAGNQAKQKRSGDPTGLVIDARGTNFIPSLSPKVRKVRGGVMFPTRNRRQQQRQGELVSLFMKDLMLAQNHPRVGDRPLVLKGLKTWGKYRTEIVLGKSSAAELNDLIKKDFLADAGVIIVLD